MATVVVGGHSRNIGKTSVAAGLIAAWPDYGWLAMKITQYGHGICSINGKSCHCAVDEHSYVLLEEKSREGTSDSARFLAAGARRSLWVRTKLGQLDRALPVLRPIFESEPFVIIESNSILRYIRPDLYIAVLRYDVSDFKPSAREFLERVDALVVVEPAPEPPVWSGVSMESLKDVPMFAVTPPEFVSRSLIDFVGSRLATVT